jgi:hypothetical protein
MNYSSKPRGNVNVKEILKKAWPEYPLASEMKFDPFDSRQYKAMSPTDEDRIVYLITNPAAWKEKKIDGRVTKIRPAPVKLGKASDYVESAAPIHGPLPKAAGARQIEW